MADYRTDPAAFIDRFLKRNEKGKRWSLSDHQRRVLKLLLDFNDGHLQQRIVLWGELKKSGKTTLAACLLLWWCFTRPDVEAKAAANDLEQSKSRAFQTAVRLLKHNPELRSSATVKATQIEFTNGSLLRAIPADYKGEAGGAQTMVSFDELWAYTQESAERLFEELTPIPTAPESWVLVTTTAGFVGESVLLERLYHRGLGGERLEGDLEVYRDADLSMFWGSVPRQPWQTEAYYASQRKLLRPTTFARLHENRWVAAESVFLTPELWDPCVDAGHAPLSQSPSLPVYAAVDASVKGDTTAVVSVAWQPGSAGELAGLVLVDHRIWRPSRERPMDLEATVEAHLRDLHGRFKLQQVLFDPFQLHRSATALRRDRLPVEEYPQTEANLTKAGQALFDLLRGRRLRLYADAELRQQALNTVAIESPRGWRIAKARASRKVDAIVALAMACRSALDHPPKKKQALTWGDRPRARQQIGVDVNLSTKKRTPIYSDDPPPPWLRSWR